MIVQGAGAVLVARGLVASGGGGGSTGVNMAAGTFRQGDGCNLDAASTPVTIAGGAFWTRGLVVANGAANVDVTWPDLKTSDRVVLTMETKGGAPSAMPLITYTAATKFTLQSFAGDTSTYGYQVQ